MPKTTVLRQGGEMPGAVPSNLLRLPDALEQQLRTKSLSHLAKLAVRADFRSFKDTVRQVEFVEHCLHALPELDLRE